MKKSLLFLAFLSIGHAVFSQVISGKILDTNQNPIPYVTLQIGPNYGVITNEEGVYTLKTHNFSDSDTVSISCLGYKSLEYPLSDFTNPTYILEESISELSEVFLTNKQLSIEEILTKIRENISSNYNTDGKQRVFIRESSNFNIMDFDFEVAKSSNFNRSTIKDINRNFELMSQQMVNSKSKYFEDTLLDLLHVADSTQSHIIKATKLVNIDKDLSTDAVNGKLIKGVLNVLDSTATYKLKTGLFTVEDSLKVGKILKEESDLKKGKTTVMNNKAARIIRNNSLVENSKLDFIFDDKGYEYTIDGISYLNDEAVYNISFNPTRKSAKYTGQMYVNTSDFAVVKLAYQFAKNRKGKKLNLKFIAGFKFEENAYRSTVIFKKNDNAIYDLYFISQENGNYVYIDRSLKFIRNNTAAHTDKQQLKIKFMIEQDYKAKSELFFLDKANLKPDAAFQITEEYPISYISEYDPSIWKDYSVLSPVQAIIDYKTN